MRRFADIWRYMLLAGVLAVLPLRAQLLQPLPSLPFAHFDRNVLQMDDSLCLERFFSRLDTLIFHGRGDVRVMHIGGSHVQAGVMTQQLRDHLLALSEDLMGGPYFVFPFSAGKTNTPAHYRVTYTGDWLLSRSAVVKPENRRMGLAGVAVTTSDTAATFSVVTRPRTESLSAPSYTFDTVTVLGYTEAGQAEPVIRWNADTVIRAERRVDDPFFHFRLPARTDSIRVAMEGLPGTFTVTGILLDNGRHGLSLQGIGANGAKVSSYLLCEDFERDLALINPDLVIFGIGINDAVDTQFSKHRFKEDYDMLISKIRKVSPDCELLFITNNDSYRRVRAGRYQVNRNGRDAEEAFLEMGRKYGAAVWNQFDVMGGLGSMQQWQGKGLAQTDKVHFTNTGYQLVGDLLYNALITEYVKHVRRLASNVEEE
ncbi:MAG: hypothetical protein IJS25_06065 [Bacteroidales bacterium]|nr:hypothetical protein [Bacteroidales bacterium]